MAKEDVLLKILNLSVQSAAGRFRDFSLSGSRGEILLITSSDGRKIASLFRVLAGLELPISGSIQYLGEKIGLILSEDELPAWSKIKHELVLFEKLNQVDEAVLSHLMEAWDLEGIYDLPMELLSPYEKTAFFLVMETAQAPALLMCQEPLAGLNPRETRKMLNNLKAYAQAGHLILLGSVNDTYYPAEFSRITLDKVQALSIPVKETPGRAVPVITAPVNDPRSPVDPGPPERLERTRQARTGSAALPETGDSLGGFGGRKLVTVFVPLPVSPQTDYELRRIDAIKYFLANDNGYDIDILEAEQDRLLALLAQRGLQPRPQIGKAEV